MEHMYVHSIVLGECVGMLVTIFGYSVKLDVYRIWNYTICSCHAAEVFPLLRFYQILSYK